MLLNEKINRTLMETKATWNFPPWEGKQRSLGYYDEVNSYLLMGSPYPTLVMVISYLLFVTKVGPILMENRKPFDLKYVMMTYNVIQIGYNMWFLSLFFMETRMSGHILKESCYPTTPPNDRYLRLFAFKLTWIWFISKVSDLFDTVFFVLRKKQSQVSFLHVYHHTQMVLIVWLYLKYVRGFKKAEYAQTGETVVTTIKTVLLDSEQGIVIGLINSVVHVVMYSYYFLAAFGPKVQRYLWWKRYITWLQMFFLLVVFFSALLGLCRVPPVQTAYNVYAAFQGVFFTFLFVKFYVKSYNKPAKKSSNMYENGQATKRVS